MMLLFNGPPIPDQDETRRVGFGLGIRIEIRTERIGTIEQNRAEQSGNVYCIYFHAVYSDCFGPIRIAKLWENSVHSPLPLLLLRMIFTSIDR